jgi:hypothetical protein
MKKASIREGVHCTDMRDGTRGVEGDWECEGSNDGDEVGERAGWVA